LPTLHVLQGPDKGRTYETPNEPVVVGRTSDHIQLSDHSASRRHAEIKPSNGAWVLCDLQSSNGTYVNGRRAVGPVKLKHGDQIKVGSTLMVFSGQEHAQLLSGPQLIQDRVDLDMSNPSGGSSILSAIDAAQESVILQAPETADAVAAWNVIYRVAETLGAFESIDAFLERVTDILFEHLIVDQLVLLMYNAEKEQLTPQIVRYRNREPGRRPKIAASQTIVEHVLKTRDGVLCANAMTDERFHGENNQDSIHRLGLRSIVCVPIVARDQIHGIFYLDCSMSHHTYTQEQLRLVVAIGRLAGLAIENVRLVQSRVRTERLAAAGEAVAYLSHHIRNILQGMQGGAEVVELAMKRQAFDMMRSGWTLMRRNLDRIYLLTLNMLTFSKDRKPRIESAHLNAILSDVVSLAQGRADEKGVMILTEFEEIPAIPIDPDGMHQVAHNILLNALEAAPKEGGRVILSTHYEPTAGCVRMAVSDNGPGIDPKDRDRIFDVFHSSKGHAGTGLGLAAAKKIVAEMNGSIDVESALNEGTTFVVILSATHIRLADSDKTHGPDA